jgi:CubicO group peptidase (beta-lactamase class C family)
MRVALLVFLALTALSCSGGGSDPPSPPPPVPEKFASVDAAMQAAHNTSGNPDIGLAIYDRNGVKVFERMYGNFSADRRVAIASASKLVSGVVLFRLIDKGYLSLSSTTGSVLGWSGANSTITLEQLLSFTSGLTPEHACTAIATSSLADCVAAISQEPLTATPGTRFDYGSTHLHVAARMAEVATGNSWNTIYGMEIVQPLGLPADLRYYTYPRQAIGLINPLVAGGMRASMNEYASVLRLVYDKGRWQGSALLPTTLFDRQTMEPFPGVAIGSSPAQSLGFNIRYGLTAWLECSTPQTGCAAISSPGAFGFTPWIDRQSGYYAILGMELSNNSNGIVSFAMTLKEQLRPLIVSAMAQ